jgi:hypothetical protein
MAEVGSRQVGEFSNHYLNARRLIPATKNPMDKCTIVSIFPKALDETKETLNPKRFQVPAGSFEEPATLVVGSSSWWREIDIDQPMLEIPVSSVSIADSVIKDYCKAKLGCDMEMAMPGLFFVLGEVLPLDIKLRYKSKLEEVKHKQDNWYKILVMIADSLWARSNNNPLVISDEMRLGARALQLNEKPWLKDFFTIDKVNCRACGSLMNPTFPVCATCRWINPEHPASKELKFAVL